MRLLPSLAATLLAVAFSPTLRAADDVDAEPSPSTTSTKDPRGIETPFAWTVDPTTPSAGTFVTSYGVSNASARGIDRPVAPDATSGVAQSFGVLYGITAHIAPFASATVQHDATGKEGATASGGVRWQLTDPNAPLKLTMIGAAFRTFDASFGSSLRVAASWDFGRFRVAGNLHAERVFSSAHDGVDVLALAGVSVRVVDALRLGVEYIGQDLEDAAEHDVEGGARHYVGPSAAIDLGSSIARVQLVGGPAYEFAGPGKGATLGRAALVVAF